MLEFKATLRVTSTKHSFEQLRNFLGEPTKGFSLGDVFSNDNKKRKHTYWALESTRSPNGQLESHLEELLDYVDSRSTLFNNIKQECDIDIFCMLSSDNGQGGAVLSSRVMKRLSSCGFDLVFDVYAE